MTTATLTAGNRTMDAVDEPRRSLEELVDQLFTAMGFKDEVSTVEQTATQSIHEARRLRQAGDVDTALAVLGDVNVARATQREVRWAFSEWKGLVKRRLGDRDAVLYSQGEGRAAALVPRVTAGRWRWRRPWGYGGGPARSSRGAASGVCVP